MQDNPEWHRAAGLDLLQGDQPLEQQIGICAHCRPVRQETIPEELVHRSAVALYDLSAFGEPASRQPRQLLGWHFLTEPGRPLQVGQQQPAADHPDIHQRSGTRLLDEGVDPDRGLSKRQPRLTDLNLDPVGQPGRLHHPLAGDIGSVAAAKVDDEELSVALFMDHGVVSRRLLVVEHQLVGWGTSNRQRARHDERLSQAILDPRGGLGRGVHSDDFGSVLGNGESRNHPTPEGGNDGTYSDPKPASNPPRLA